LDILVNLKYDPLVDFFIALSFCGITGFYATTRSKRKPDFMQTFALENGYTFSLKADLHKLDGAIFHISDHNYLYDVVSGIYKGHTLDVFYYNFVVGRTTNAYTVLRSTFNVPLPNMFLETNDRTYGEIAFTNYGNATETVQLEGDFNKYFTLKVRKGSEANAFEIFTPDIMAELLDKYRHYSFEILDTYLFIYASWTITDREKLLSPYTAGEYFVDKLEPSL
jgi:hypothetical protein